MLDTSIGVTENWWKQVDLVRGARVSSKEFISLFVFISYFATLQKVLPWSCPTVYLLQHGRACPCCPRVLLPAWQAAFWKHTKENYCIDILPDVGRVAWLVVREIARSQPGRRSSFMIQRCSNLFLDRTLRGSWNRVVQDLPRVLLSEPVVFFFVSKRSTVFKQLPRNPRLWQIRVWQIFVKDARWYRQSFFFGSTRLVIGCCFGSFGSILYSVYFSWTWDGSSKMIGIQHDAVMSNSDWSRHTTANKLVAETNNH